MSRTAAILVAVTLGACAHAKPPTTQLPPADTAGLAGEALPAPVFAERDDACCARCPLALAGVHLRYAENAGGATLLFTTSQSSDEAELRARVTELANYHNHADHRLALLTVPHRASTQHIDGGARVDLLPSASNDAQTFRMEVQKHVAWMQEGHCPPVGADAGCESCNLQRAPH